MAEKLRVAIVGCGILGTNHARIFTRIPHTVVVAVAKGPNLIAEKPVATTVEDAHRWSLDDRVKWRKVSFWFPLNDCFILIKSG